MPSESRKKSGFGGFQPSYRGTIFDHPLVQKARRGMPSETSSNNLNSLRSQSMGNLPPMKTEYTYRFEGEKYNIPKYEKKDKPIDPWNLDAMVEQKLKRTKTTLNFRRGALPAYGGHVPGYKFRFGESFAALSVRIPK
ncbi:Oidioi.mRNA.OKI2018_I69.chr2.g5295.t1.cds [Oikopleura dioica]|uniref:Oidioi.mRNA.OKI2018_I69.chr2.g5295.t1.cds n=1 Tax=Oikopleura dioica TaxID=34765 RepID=A0ABN7SZM7_OIKDI|nr:Oidioi.mRNA.OKI2018_I69.chr2.g5295.t1.cds [Oikopleura dioica]